VLEVGDHDGVVVDVVANNLDRVATDARRAQFGGVVNTNVDLATDGLVETSRFGSGVRKVLFVLVNGRAQELLPLTVDETTSRVRCVKDGERLHPVLCGVVLDEAVRRS